jgi:hypothetical protein
VGVPETPSLLKFSSSLKVLKGKWFSILVLRSKVGLSTLQKMSVCFFYYRQVGGRMKLFKSKKLLMLVLVALGLVHQNSGAASKSAVELTLVVLAALVFIVAATRAPSRSNSGSGLSKGGY